MLRGERIILRARLDSDVPMLHAGLHDDPITHSRTSLDPWQPLPVDRSPFTLRPNDDGKAAVFTVADPETDTPLGGALLWGIDTHNRNAHLGLSLVPAARGRGLAGEATRLLCHYGFVLRGLHRLQIETLADNDAMIRTALSAGFVHEGTLRRSAWVAGQWLDELLYGQLAEDWVPGTS